MNIKYYTQEKNPWNSESLCACYHISGIDTFSELLALYQAKCEKHFDNKILITLDDPHQAEYTSFHSMSSNEICAAEDHVLEELVPGANKLNDPYEHLTIKSRFIIREKNFKNNIKTFQDACDVGLTLDYSDWDLLRFNEINTDPFSIIDKNIFLLPVPVEHSYEMFYALPNGYFSDDMPPFENFALIKRLELLYKYKLFGIGASFLAFIREEPLENDMAELIANDIIVLYNDKDNIMLKNSIRQCIKNKSILILKYTE